VNNLDEIFDVIVGKLNGKKKAVTMTDLLKNRVQNRVPELVASGTKSATLVRAEIYKDLIDELKRKCSRERGKAVMWLMRATARRAKIHSVYNLCKRCCPIQPKSGLLSPLYPGDAGVHKCIICGAKLR
jgi:hypothetical protein